MHKQAIPVGHCQCGCGEPTRPANRTDPRRASTKGVPVRYRPGHAARAQELTSPLDRTYARMRVHPLGCWEWKGALNKGYGVVGGFYPDGTKTLFATHRVVYEDWQGPIPPGMDLDHLCANPCCCNPTHLEPVTRAENVRRQWRAGRANPPAATKRRALNA